MRNSRRVSVVLYAERAAAARVTHGRLRLRDAIVLACAQELNCELLSYDERLARISRKRTTEREE
jgi:predicted nucleic acid-binding protein